MTLSDERDIKVVHDGDKSYAMIVYPADKLKAFIKKVLEDFEECRDKTDIWGSERWDKFEKMFIKKIIKDAGPKLI